MMKEGKTTGEINKYVVANYNVDATTVEKDLIDFMEMLNHYSLKEEDEKA